MKNCYASFQIAGVKQRRIASKAVNARQDAFIFKYWSCSEKRLMLRTRLPQNE